MPREFRRARKIDNRICRARCFVRELIRQKNRRLRNSKIRRPLSVSFTQRNSAAYFSGVKSALNRERSFRSTGAIRFGLSAVRLLDNAVNMEGPENGHSAF